MNKKCSKIMKGVAPWMGAVALVSSAALVGCGDDSSSGTFSMEDSFEMVLAKADYSYSKKDSTLKKILPVCKQGTLGNLVGPDDTDEWDTVTYKAYESKSVVSLQEDGQEKVKYSLEDGSFLDGFWTDPDYASQKIQNGFRFDGDGQVQTVIRYDGSCLMKDFYSLFRKDAPAIKNMDETLVNFYSEFLAEGDSVNEEMMLADIRAVDCDELSLFDGLVKLNVEDFNESSGNIRVSYGERTCDVSFQIRYAYDQEDCAAAFEDFQNDRLAAKNFKFDDYGFDVTYGGDDKEYCLDYLILDLKKEKGISTKKNFSSAAFARGVVNLMVGGLN